MIGKVLILALYFTIKGGDAIQNGQDAPSNIAPYRVSLRAYNDKGDYHICDGLILSENKVLTTAFNIDRQTPDNLTAVVGLNNTILPPQNISQEDDKKNDISSYIVTYTEYFSCIIANAFVLPHHISNHISKYLNPFTGGQNKVSSVVFYSCDVLLKEKAPSGPQRHNVSSIIIHEDFNSTTFKNNIALVYIADTFKFSDSVQPANLATVARHPGDKCLTVAGGSININGTLPEKLQELSSEIITLEKCNRRYGHDPKSLAIDDSEICVEYEKKDQGACRGDGGAALLNNDEVIGLVSYAVICARGYPDVHTNVSYFRDWINNH